MITHDQTATDLEAAADALDTFGWCQGKVHDPATGAYCAMGAIDRVTVVAWLRTHDRLTPARRVPTEVDRRRVRAVSELMRRLPPTPTGSPTSVESWNDEGDRTQGDVTDLLRRTAKELREGQP